MDKILLVFLGIILILILVALFIWRFIFRRSVRKMLMTFLGILMENSSQKGLDEPIEMDDSVHRADTMLQKADEVNFEEALAQVQPAQVQEAQLPSEVHREERDTSDSGWPRQLDDETRLDPRPFLDVRLHSDTEPNSEDFNEEMDTETKSDILPE
jgi:hypothetical protein